MQDNSFYELLIHTLKQTHIRLDRLEAKVDEKADKADVKALGAKLDEKADKADVKALGAKLDEKADKADVKALGAKLDEKADKADVKALRQDLDDVKSRLGQIESEIRTFKWMFGAGLAAMGVLMAFLRMF